MEKGILITQCLQQDFVKPIGKYDPLPNLLHVGHSEANRLMGENISKSPVYQVMEWAYNMAPEKLRIIHIRDWHDGSDPAQKPHLERFGPHCLKDSEGAGFVFDEPAKRGNPPVVINASGLNDFINTGLSQVLDHYKSETDINVGIMGVWTEAKVSFLTYDLATRYPNFKIGVCSALTAGSSRVTHFQALDRIKKILGIEIFSSIGAFTTFLCGTAPPVGIKNRRYAGDIHFRGEASETDRKIIYYLFKSSKSVDLMNIDGGFSGNLVLKANSVDNFGHQEVPTVIKIGPRDMIGKERMAFERIQEVLGNSAPNIVDYVEIEARGGIKYRYASMIDGRVITFQEFYEKNYEKQKVDEYLDTVFKKQLGRFYDAAELEKLDLFAYYDFNSKYALHIKKNMESIPGVIRQNGIIEILPGISVQDVCPFYEQESEKKKFPYAEQHYMSYLHGDLNGKNIIIDAQSNVWLIDFFHTHRGHILKDLIKLENDLLFIFTKLKNEEELKEGIRLSDCFFRITDILYSPPDSMVDSFSSPEIQKAFFTLKKIRSFYPGLVRSDRNPCQLFIGFLRYAMHTLSFDESNDLQKKWAIYTGSLCASQIDSYLSDSTRLRINYVDTGNHYPGAKLGITILPGRKDWNRNTQDDILVMKEEMIFRVLCLITEEEFHHYGVDKLKQEYEENGISTMYFPIRDQTAPDPPEATFKLFDWLEEGLSTGKNTLIHCAGGLGRSGMIASGFLKKKTGLPPEQAIARIREARGSRAVETRKQEEFVFRC